MSPELLESLLAELRGCISRTPFLPFGICTADGRFHGVYRATEMSFLDHAVYLTSVHGGWIWMPYECIVTVQSIVDEADEFDTLAASA